jgi:bacterioferritin-associated ferredoxin
VSRRPTAATCESIRHGNLPRPRGVGRCCGWCEAHTPAPQTRSGRAPAWVRGAVVTRRPTAATSESIRPGDLPRPRGVGRCCGWCEAHTPAPQTRSGRAPAWVRGAVVSRRPTAATCESIRHGDLPRPRGVGRCCGWCEAHTPAPLTCAGRVRRLRCGARLCLGDQPQQRAKASGLGTCRSRVASDVAAGGARRTHPRAGRAPDACGGFDAGRGCVSETNRSNVRKHQALELAEAA